MEIRTIGYLGSPIWKPYIATVLIDDISSGEVENINLAPGIVRIGYSADTTIHSHRGYWERQSCSEQTNGVPTLSSP